MEDWGFFSGIGWTITGARVDRSSFVSDFSSVTGTCLAAFDFFLARYTNRDNSTSEATTSNTQFILLPAVLISEAVPIASGGKFSEYILTSVLCSFTFSGV